MKSPLNIDEQVTLLINRNLIADRSHLSESLNHISYYKLSGYFYIFQDKQTNYFYDDTDFRKILNLYNFDQELRKILLGYLHIIEISLASQIVNHFCNKNQTALPHLDNKLFYQQDIESFKKFQKTIERKIDRGQDHAFIKHNIKTYKQLPLWVLIEILDFGDLVYIYKGIPQNIALEISKTYTINNTKYFTSILESLRILRNKSAHSNRVYNTSNYRSLYLSKNTKDLLNRDLNKEYDKNKVFLIITVMKYLLDIIKPNNQFREELETIIENYEIDVKYMGANSNWKYTDIWSNDTINEYL